jgi:predicted PhzF superfamily epimerase YddE/YHI9
MDLPVYFLSAFTGKGMQGNAAAICLLDGWLPDKTLQGIASRIGLSETAFLVPRGEGNTYELRWFTPIVEVGLCGHATLGAAHVLFSTSARRCHDLTFETRAGWLAASRDGKRIALNFPEDVPQPCSFAGPLPAALSIPFAEIWAARDYMAVYRSEDQIRSLRVDLAVLRKMDLPGLIVTAPGEHADFVSRYFAPSEGIDEDAVTGSAHCTLLPYWSAKLHRAKLHALQLSESGGEIWGEIQGSRVILSGSVKNFRKGSLELPASLDLSKRPAAAQLLPVSQGAPHHRHNREVCTSEI